MLHAIMIPGDEDIRPCGAVKEKINLITKFTRHNLLPSLSRTPLADDADASIGYEDFEARL
jgi:hypothetical protein